MRLAYFDCFAGASGDMILGALIDCGLSLDVLSAELASLPLSGYRIEARPVKRGALGGTQVSVLAEQTQQEMRSLSQIIDIINASALSGRIKEQSCAIFTRLAGAEARVHRIPVEEVHFHELGAMDTVVDIVGAVTGLDLLGIKAVHCSPIPVAHGSIKTSHGLLPLPAPATLELLAMAKAPVRPAGDPEAGELVTPTAAAILTSLASFDVPAMTIVQAGYGAGARDPGNFPNVLRLWIGEAVRPHGHDLLLLETNIDNMNPEIYGYVMELLFERGARDAWFTPIQMKKNRPAVMLSVLCSPEVETDMVRTIMRETSTLGVRIHSIRRHESDRSKKQVSTSLGPVGVKLKYFGEALLNVAPEYEDCRRIAIERGMPLQEVYRVVSLEANQELLKDQQHGAEG